MAYTNAEPLESEVPIWPHFVRHVLTVLADGSTLHRRDIVSRAIDSAQLSESARAETLNRVDSARNSGSGGRSATC